MSGARPWPCPWKKAARSRVVWLMLNDRSHALVSHDRLADHIRAARSHPLASVTPLERRGSGLGARILTKLGARAGAAQSSPAAEPGPS